MTQRRLVRQPRRSREWFHGKIAFSLAAGVQNAIILDTGMEVEEKKDATIVRLIIDFIAGPTGDTQLMDAAWGIALMNADAHAASAFPDPEQLDVEDTDWMWLMPHVEHLRGAGAHLTTRYTFDLSSKRKYKDRNDILVFVTKNTSGTTALFVQGFVRMMILAKP